MNNYKNSISIIVPSIYPDLWPSIIENYNSNSVHVEIIFIGPKECKFLLPKRVKFLKTNFKVVQCLEMGLRSATSFYIFESCDDVMFKAEGSLDPLGDMVKTAKNFPNKIISIGYATNGKKFDVNDYGLIANHPRTIAPSFLLLTQEIINQVGGYNSNYIASFAGLDLNLRARKLGREIVKLNNIYMDEVRDPKDPDANLGLLSFRYLGHDMKYLKYNWIDYDKKKNMYFLRDESLEKFLPFDQNNLFTKEQGKGTAKIFKSQLFINLMKFKIFRYAALIGYKFIRKFILRKKFY
jgi:hypothetical protein